MAADLSVVLAARGGLASVAETLRHLRAQTARERIEIVVVTDGDATDTLSACAGFAGHRWVVLPELRSRAAANAVGFGHAGADVIAFAEDHCFPEPGWAEALLRRHQESWAAVGPELVNDNPQSLVAWSDFLLNYAPWARPARGGEVAELPGYNTSYKRLVLERAPGDLAAALEIESEMHRAMIARGERLYLESTAVVRHRNISRWPAWLRALFHGGRLYAATRARGWSRARRLGFALAWPLVALVRLWRLRAVWPDAAPAFPRLAPVLLAGLWVDAAGQAIGAIGGAGGASARLARVDFARAEDSGSAERRGRGGSAA